MVRQLQSWYENLNKRQVKTPKIYLRDSGLLHALLSLPDFHTLHGHPRVGASWEGFAIEQVLEIIRPPQAFFWATHSGAEVDLFFIHNGRRYGIECKFSETPKTTRSMNQAIESLNLDHVWIIYPGEHAYPLSNQISVWPLQNILRVTEQLQPVR
jgi:predicted AAA+ superfamily ATPase